MDKYLVSCLCITHERVALLERAVSCFLHQTYSSRELVVVCESDDSPTRELVATISNRAATPIVLVEVDSSQHLSLGSRRNAAVQASRGHYVAQWDDDDWHAPTRLEEQIRALQHTGRRGCVLARLLLFDTVTHKAYVSAGRPWEGSLLAERSVIPPFPEVGHAEDTEVVSKLRKQKLLCFLDKPGLYIYVFHGRNTWNREHWESRLVAHAQPLSSAENERVKMLLDSGATLPVS